MSRDCTVCGCVQARLLREIRYVLPDDSTLPRVTEIKRCLNCGFVYADSGATAGDYLHHYKVNSIYAATDIRAGAGLDVGDLARLSKTVRRIAPHLGSADLLIDIGAGGGGLLEIARSSTGCSILGIDPDPRCVEAMIGHGLPAITGTLDALSTEYSGHAKIVTLSHVLEHLWQPQLALKAAFRLLAANGLAYVETPDAARYADFANAPFYYFDPEHINHFSMQGLMRLAREAGGSWVGGGQDEIMLSDGTPYPVCWGLIAAQSGPLVDAGPGPGLERYILQQSAAVETWRQLVMHHLDAFSGPFIIWGAGSQTQRVLADHFFNVDRVAVFADGDRSKQGRTMLGRPILAPAEALSRHQDLPVVIMAARAASAAIYEVMAREWPQRAVIQLPTA